jgi:MFS family permease
VPWLIVGLPAGVWVDLLPVRRLMIGCDLVQALVFASVPLAAWAGLLTVGQMVAVALVAGTANVLFSTAYQVILPRLVTREDLVEGNAKLQGSASVASIAGRGGSGLLAGPPAILLNSVSFLVSAVCVWRIKEKGEPRPPRRGRPSVREGIRYVVVDPYLRALTAGAVLANLGFGGAAALFVVFLIRVAGLHAGTVGLLLAVTGFGGILGAVVARRLAGWIGMARALWLVPFVTGGLATVLIPSGRAAGFACGALLLGAGSTVVNVVTLSFRQAYCPEEMLGRVVSAMRFVAFGGSPVGALVAGGLGSLIGVRNALWVMLSVYTAAILPRVLTREIWSGRDLPGPH